jgi:hypothetical protein
MAFPAVYSPELFYAARNGDYTKAQALLEAGADPIATYYKDGSTVA